MTEQQTTEHEIPGFEFEVAVTAEAVDGHRKIGTFQVPESTQEFIVYCDEGTEIGGANSAPPPISYFLQSAAFCTLTQLKFYGGMMKIDVKKAKIAVRARFRGEGSVLRETIRGKTLSFEFNIDVESDAPPERVAALIRNAEAGCFVMQAIRNPTAVETAVTLNGNVLKVEA